MKIHFLRGGLKMAFAALVGMASLSETPATAQTEEPKKAAPANGGQVPPAPPSYAQEGVANDINRAQQYLLGTTADETLRYFLGADGSVRTYNPPSNDTLWTVTAARDPVEELFGATFSKLDDTLRAQLAVPADRGLVVSTLQNNGPSAQAGLQQYDVLLTLTDKPLASTEDLSKLLKAAGEAEAALKILRQGKPMTLKVQPVYRVTIGSAGEEKKEYFLGVQLEPVEDAVRAQTGLPAGRGLVIAEVVKATPAEKAGLKVNDIIVELAGKPMDKRETLSAQVQVIGDKPTTLKVLRAGQHLDISITPAVRKKEEPTEFGRAARVWKMSTPTTSTPYTTKSGAKVTTITSVSPTLKTTSSPYSSADETQQLRERLAAAEKELKSLRKLEDLQKEIKDLHAAVERLIQEKK